MFDTLIESRHQAKRPSLVAGRSETERAMGVPELMTARKSA